jgi:predicted Zn-dependent peptidase
MIRLPRSRRALAAAGLATLALLVGAGLALDRASAQPAGADRAALIAPVDKDPRIPFEKYTLDNGLEVILMPDQSVPLVYVSVWYHVGSGYEVPGKSGFAHLFEHMLFQGSGHVPADKHFDILKKVGSSVVNGTTNPDRTNYFEQVPSNELETALWLESDRMGFLLPTLTRESLDNQIDVVRNERRQNYDNVAYRRTLFTQYAAMYPEGHPYRYLTIGRHEDLATATLDDVKGFYKTWYVPANATLVVGGDFDVAAAKGLVQKWFGGFPKSTKPAVVPIPMPTVTAKEVAFADNLAKLRQIQFVWHTPANFAPGDAELDIAADALGREGTGRLYRILVHEKQLAQFVSVSQQSMQFSSIFDVTVRLRPDADEAVVRQIVAAEIDRLRREPLADREIKRAVTSFEARAVYGMESLLGRAERLQAYNHYLGDPDSLTRDLDRYRKTTADAIRDTVARHLVDDRRVVVVTTPAEGGTP